MNDENAESRDYFMGHRNYSLPQKEIYILLQKYVCPVFVCKSLFQTDCAKCGQQFFFHSTCFVKSGDQNYDYYCYSCLSLQ